MTKAVLSSLIMLALGVNGALFNPAYAVTSSLSIGGKSDNSLDSLLPGFSSNYNKKEKIVVVSKLDGSAKAFIQLMPPVPYLSTTKAYAQNVMDSYAGWGLTAQIARRGFSFQYVDNAPCAALISYFDGASYLMFGACGLITSDELNRAFFIAKQQLGIDDIIYRSAMPTIYY